MENTKFANSSTLGLVGFGMTTILLNLHNAGFFGLNATIASMGLMLGGATQIIAGVIALRDRNLFGGTAFVAYGFFWWSLVAIVCNPFAPAFKNATAPELASYLLLWGIFTGFMFLASLKHAKITQIIFGSLTLLFFLLAAGDFTGNKSITVFAGFVGLFCGAFAMYDGLAQLVNEEYGKKILPLG